MEVLSITDRRSLYPLLTAILAIALMTCKEDPNPPTPLVQTGQVTNIDSQGAQFNGFISSAGSGSVTVGFVWDVNITPIVSTSPKVVLGDVKQGAIRSNITFDMVAGKRYYVRAFGQSASVSIYGDTVSFISKGASFPVITSFEPAVGIKGTIFAVNGKNFSGQIANIQASFGGHSLMILDASPEKLTLQIPNNFPLAGNVQLTVVVSGRSTTSVALFQLQ